MAGSEFEFSGPGRVVFGAGVARQVGSALASLGATRVLWVTGHSVERGQAARVASKLPAIVFSIPSEPTLDMVSAGRALAIKETCDAVVALGGGSAIDAGKAIAALVGNDGDLLDYMEVIGKAQVLPRRGLPCIAIPTTAGTGAEVTRNSVIASPQAQVKASLRSPYLLPVLALVDPDLLADVPRAVLAPTGLDALSHLLESFVSIRANAFTLALAREGMIRLARSLRLAFEQGLDADRREDLAIASLFGGLCLANSGLGAVHGFAAPLGGMWKAPHGAVCAALLPAVMRANLAALCARLPDSPSLPRYRELNDLLAHGGDAVAWVADLTRVLGIPGLSQLGVRGEDISRLVEKAKLASSMRGNPVVLGDGELTAIVNESM